MWRVIRDGGRRLFNFIRFQGVKSSRYSVEQGLREGSALSPTLFLVIIDPFIRACKEAGYGLTVELAVLGRSMSFRIYDTRHWNQETGAWEVHL